MNKADKDKVEQLADALIADALQCETETELFHSLERMRIGMAALRDFCAVKEAIK